MMRLKNLMPVIFILSLAIGLGACTATEERPPYDKVHVYAQPYDYTFLKTMLALNTFRNWILEETDKEAGMIKMQNIEYGHLFDRDKQTAEFLVSRVDKDHTSVQLVVSSQRVREAADFFQRIDTWVKARPGQTTAVPVPTAPPEPAA